MPLILEDFEVLDRGAAPGATLSNEEVETAKAASYELGYKAGWDDAAKSDNEEQVKIQAELARHLQDMSFTFHEARTHMIHSIEPLLQELVQTFFPKLAREMFDQLVIETLQPMIEECSDRPIEIVVSPENLPVLQASLDSAGLSVFTLTEEATLAECQAYLRVGPVEKKIDLTDAMERVSSAIAALTELHERSAQNG